MANKFCNSCGASMDANASFCTNCGTTVNNPAQPLQQPYYQPAQPAFQNNFINNDQPLGIGQYIGMFILMGIPLVGFILTLVWAFGSNVNTNKKNYARAVLILGVIAGILMVIFYGIIIAAMSSIFSSMGTNY
ncbi:MAG: zinc-ribbon domain-containing protein [Saccharofermentanales bacterium]